MNTPITTPVVHPKKRREVPKAVVYGIGVLALAVTFSGGYAAGLTTEQPTGGALAEFSEAIQPGGALAEVFGKPTP